MLLLLLTPFDAVHDGSFNSALLFPSNKSEFFDDFLDVNFVRVLLDLVVCKSHTVETPSELNPILPFSSGLLQGVSHLDLFL